MQAETALSEGRVRKVIPIVPYSVKGRYRNIKTAILVLAYGIYFSLPWLTWHGDSRVGQPLLFDIANSRFHFFDVVIYPQDLMIFMSMMVLAAVILFIAATLYGRIFCGFFCFQTVWTDAFRFIETAIQGEAQARIRLRKEPWGLVKLYKIATTHMLWILLSIATAVTFTLYFAEAPTLITQIISGDAAMAAYTAIVTITATTYAAAGFAKEDVCRVACPYGKFQSVMQDPGTKTVIYDTERGERASGRAVPTKDLKDAKLREKLGLGDCIDCGYCVNVCPTGVDIRKGFQIDCISCGLCIDACNNIMQSINLPKDLISFRPTVQQTDKIDSNWIQASKLKKYGYLSLLVICAGFLVFKITHLEPFVATIQQQGQPLVTRLSNGDIKSRYIIRLANKSTQKEQYAVISKDLPFDLAPRYFEVPAGKTYTYTYDLVLSAEAARQLRAFTLIISPGNNPAEAREYRMGYVSSSIQI